MTSNSLQQGLECQAGKLWLLIFEVFARLSTWYSGQVAYCGSEAVVVVSPGLQADDSEVNAITTAYLNINMVEVARSCVGYPSCTHLIWWRPTGILLAIQMLSGIVFRVDYTSTLIIHILYKPPMF